MISGALGKKQKRIGWVAKTFFILTLFSTALITLVGGGVYWHFARGLPRIITVLDYRPLVVTRILGAGGKEEQLLGELYKEKRYLVPYDKIPDLVVRAFISAEDDRFFEHQGVNFAAVLRASIANFRAGHVVQGGSTITQQVAKSLLLTPERSFMRKIKEVILAGRIEKNLSKEQILYLYLNQIYLGHGAYGVQAASRTYFRKDISAVSLAESALLAGLPQAPGKYSPWVNPKKAKERQLYVLRRMYESGFITQSQMTEAAAQPLKIFYDENLNAKYAGYFVEHIRRYLLERYGEKATYEDGLTVEVSSSRQLSLVAQRSLREGLRALDKRGGYRGPIRHLKDAKGIEEALKDQRLKLIERKLSCQLLMPDGRLDAFEAIKHAGIRSDVQLLDENEIYEGVITSVDDRRRVAGVMIGAAKGELSAEKMRWARPGREIVPSKLLSKGDVIQVRVIKAATDGSVLVALEQEPEVQGALFSLDIKTGNVLAMEGGFDFSRSEFNRAVQALRQPGSAFKPVIYSAALEKGYTPTSIIVDSPIVYEDEEHGKWKPTNFEEKFYGDTTFRQALIKSRNVPTIKIVQAVGVSYVIEYAKRLGINTQFSADLSISLGSASVSLVDLTRVYAVFSRLGKQVDPIFLNSVRDRDGKVLEEHKPQPPADLGFLSKLIAHGEAEEPAAKVSERPKPILPVYPLAEDASQVLDPRVAYVMTHLMKEVVTSGTGHEAKSLGRVAAGKTGTTNDYIDAWFMGFTPHVVTGVWVGYDNQRSIGSGETGARAALPIWLSFMKEAVQAYPEDADFTVPPGVVFSSIDSITGKLAPSNSSQSIREAFIEGSEPVEPADSTGPARASGGTQSEFLKEDIE